MAGEGICSLIYRIRASQVTLWVKNSVMQETQVLSAGCVSCGWEDPLRRAWQSLRILAWTIPWTEEPGGCGPQGRIETTQVRWPHMHTCTPSRQFDLWQCFNRVFCLMEPRLHVCHFSFEKNAWTPLMALLCAVKRLPRGSTCWGIPDETFTLARWEMPPGRGPVLSKWEFCLRQQKQRTDLG